MGHTLTSNSYIKVPEYKVYTEHDLKMLGVYFVHEYDLQEFGFYPLVELPVVVDDLDAYTVTGHEFTQLADVMTASPVLVLKDSESLTYILKQKLAKLVNDLEAGLVDSPYYPVFLNRAYRTEFAFSNLCEKSTNSAKLLSVYLKITMLLQKDFT